MWVMPLVLVGGAMVGFVDGVASLVGVPPIIMWTLATNVIEHA